MLEQKFTDVQLNTIRDQAAIYDCACPAQLCREIGEQRRLYAYQAQCLNRTEVDRQVHERIAAAVRLAHAEMERALEDVLRLEGWDRDTLEMPAGLQKRLLATAEYAGR